MNRCLIHCKQKLLLVILMMMACMACADVLAADLVLVRDGKSVAPIMIPENLPPRTREAVSELVSYIEKTSGARPEVIEGTPAARPARAIWVGYQPVLKTLFPEADFDFKHHEEIFLIANEHHLAILGRDVYDPAQAVVQGPRGPLKDIQSEYGTVNAIYTFLQDQLGVRWLWPGEIGEDIDVRHTITIKPFEYRYHPQIRGRGGLLNFSALEASSGYGRSQDWVRRQRLLYSSLNITGGHAFTDWWERYHETHPEYFALQPDGTRTPAGSPKTVKLCQSNPAVWDQWLANVEQEIKDNPHKVVFNVTSNDSYRTGTCVCPNCRAWDAQDGRSRRYNWKGKAETYVAMTDRYLTFTNHLAAKLKARYPDKNYYVLMYSYGPSRPAPMHVKPAENVMIGCVSNFLLRHGLKDSYSSDGVTYKEQFKAWGEIAPHLAWRPNIGSPVGWQQGLPDIDLTQTIKDFELIRNANVVAIFMDANWEHWATQGPQNYLMAQLTWNLDADMVVIMDDYYQRGFGPAADTIKNYWQLMEDTRNQVQGPEGVRVEEIPNIYNDTFYEKALGLLAQADRQIDQIAPGTPAHDKQKLYRKRIGFLRAGMDWSQLLTRTWALWPPARKGKDARDIHSPQAEQARENWKKMHAIANDAAYPYAINWGPVRPITRRMRGLYPGDAAQEPLFMTRGKKAASSSKTVVEDE